MQLQPKFTNGVTRGRTIWCPLTFNLVEASATPEVRALPSVGITQLQRSYDPVRLPPLPPPASALRPLPSHRTGPPPITRTTFPTCRAYCPCESSGCSCRLLPRSRGLPQMAGGSASALSLSRPLRWPDGSFASATRNSSNSTRLWCSGGDDRQSREQPPVTSTSRRRSHYSLRNSCGG
jgi:hypothetical protein